ncbi:hypothetical protein NF700_06925 [Sphingomonadaceae bacterium OTU29MARTA1]|nr:hypothetical protein NF700_06925 [Sphingomonadaceae bacterium OTU29MARTA1]
MTGLKTHNGVLGLRTSCIAVALSALCPTHLYAQIIDDNTRIPAQQSTSSASFEIVSDSKYASNALAYSNLPGGLDLASVSDVVWVKGASGSFAQQLTKNVGIVGAVAAHHVNFFDHPSLNYVSLASFLGIGVQATQGVALFAGASCNSERDDSSFRQFYGHCGPLANLSLRGGRLDRTHVELSVTGRMALGDRNRFARFNEVAAGLRFETGGRVRFRIEPRGFVRRYADLEGLPAGLAPRRTDYRAGVEVGLRHVSRRFEIGLVGEPSVNWSTQARFRFWDARVGPVIKLRF